MSTIQIKHSYVEVNGVRLHVAQAGPESGPPVLLLHGFPEFWRGWIKQIIPLAEAGYRILAPDQRGYNLSAKPVGINAYTLNILASDMVELLGFNGFEQAHVVGHDWGAAVAWHIATRYPQWVDKLVILNVPHPAVMMRTLGRSLTQLKKSWYMFFFQIPYLPERLLSQDNWEPLADMMRRSSRPGTFTDEDLEHYRAAWSQPGAMTGMLNWYRNMVRKGFRQLHKQVQLPRITAPTLMLWGVKDAALDRSMAQPSIDLCDEGRLVFFEGATHWVQHEEAQLVNKLILEFCATN